MGDDEGPPVHARQAAAAARNAFSGGFASADRKGAADKRVVAEPFRTFRAAG